MTVEDLSGTNIEAPREVTQDEVPYRYLDLLPLTRPMPKPCTRLAEACNEMLLFCSEDRTELLADNCVSLSNLWHEPMLRRGRVQVAVNCRDTSATFRPTSGRGAGHRSDTYAVLSG